MANAVKFSAKVTHNQVVSPELAAFEGQEVDIVVTVKAPANDAAPKQLRKLGLLRGQFTVPEDFDDPLPPEIQRYFDGESDPEDHMP